jgi:hypothetical protein
MRPRGVPPGSAWAIVLLGVGFIAVTPFAAVAQEQKVVPHLIERLLGILAEAFIQ